MLRFAKLVLSSEEGAQCIQTERLLIEGVLEMEFCRLCEKLSFAQISSAGKAFKNVLAKGMQRELDEFGVHIYEVLISELRHSKQVASTSA